MGMGKRRAEHLLIEDENEMWQTGALGEKDEETICKIPYGSYCQSTQDVVDAKKLDNCVLGILRRKKCRREKSNMNVQKKFRKQGKVIVVPGPSTQKSLRMKKSQSNAQADFLTSSKWKSPRNQCRICTRLTTSGRKPEVVNPVQTRH